MKTLLVIFLALLATSVIADDAHNVVIEKAYARAAIKQQRNSAAFMNITNQGNIQSAIVYANSPAAKIVELHTHINDNGVMRMRKINQIDLPEQEMVQLKPGGLHVMLLGLTRDLRPDEKIDITLGFQDGSEKLLQVPIENMMMRTKKNMQSHKMDGGLPAMITH